MTTATALESLVPQLHALLRQPPQHVDAQQHPLLAQTRTALSDLLSASRQPPPTQWLNGLEAGACALLLLGDAALSESDELQHTLCSIGSRAIGAGHELQALWDALIGRALPLVRVDTTVTTLSRVLNVFLQSAATGVGSDELAFVAQEGTALGAHIRRQTEPLKTTVGVKETLLDAAIAAATASSRALDDPLAGGADRVRLALSLLVLRALRVRAAPPLSLQRRETVLLQLQSRVVTQLVQRHPFPSADDPYSALALALSVNAVQDDNTISTTTAINVTWPSVLVRQFALLRVTNLPLQSVIGSSWQSTAYRDISVSTLALLDDLAHVTHSSRLDPAMVVLSLQMLDACAVEATAFFQRVTTTMTTTTATTTGASPYAALVRALGTAYAPELLNKDVLREFTGSPDVETHVSTIDSVSTATSAAVWDNNETAAVLTYLRTLYTTVSALLRVLVERLPVSESDATTTDALVQAFVTLSRLEFARESCASADVNACMSALTQQVEDAVEREYAQLQPPRILSTILQSVAGGSAPKDQAGTEAWPSSASVARPNESVSRDVDVIFGAQALAVGVLVQRKLRVVLFSQPALVDDALALVFSGLSHCYEPLDAFAHTFLGFCLTTLGSYVSVYTVAPFYLERTLATYPRVQGDSSRTRSLPTAIGVIFGALYYAAGADSSRLQASDSVGGRWTSLSLSAWTSKRDATVLTPSQQMVVWAMKQCCNRIAALVLSGNDARDLKSGVFLASVVFEVLKMGPLDLLAPCAMEVELLLSRCAEEAETDAATALDALKTQLFASVSQNCESEKRAWLAAWFVELDALYGAAQVSVGARGVEAVAPMSERKSVSPHARL